MFDLLDLLLLVSPLKISGAQWLSWGWSNPHLFHLKNTLLIFWRKRTWRMQTPLSRFQISENAKTKTIIWSYRISTTIRDLQYVMLTRTDFAFGINKVCHYVQTLTHDHWQTLEWVLRYLKNTLSYWLFISNHRQIQFSNENWAVFWIIENLSKLSNLIECKLSFMICKETRNCNPLVHLCWNQVITKVTTELVFLNSLLQEIVFSLPWSQAPWCDNLDKTYLTAN